MLIGTSNKAGKPLSDPEREVLLYLWQDAANRIAAIKERRWSICQSVVGLNIALATATLALKGAEAFFIFASMFAAVMGFALLKHGDRRMKEARDLLRRIRGYVRQNVYDFHPVTQLPYEGVEKPENWDMEEGVAYIAVIVASVSPVVVTALNNHSLLPAL